MELLPYRTLDPLFDMTPSEAAAFVRKCGRRLREHADDVRRAHEEEEALAGVEMISALLREIRPAYPAEQAKIDELLRQHRPEERGVS